jgi:hypothetical protein
MSLQVQTRDPEELNKIAEAWIQLQELGVNGSEEASDALIWSYEAVYDLVAGSPHTAWQFILTVMAMTQNEEVLGNLAAGPLEDLLAGHGAEIFPEVLSAASSDRSLLKLIGCISTTRIDPDVTRQLAAILEPGGRGD